MIWFIVAQIELALIKKKYLINILSSGKVEDKSIFQSKSNKYNIFLMAKFIIIKICHSN